MSHLLPPQGHPVRELFQVEDLVAISTGQKPVAWSLPLLKKQVREARAADPAVRSMTFFKVNPTNDQLELVTIGPRGGWIRNWVFGPVTKQTRLL